MSEPVKVFGIEDYQQYFASASIPTATDNEASDEVIVSSDETTQVVPETTVESSTQNIEAGMQSMVHLSLGTVIALGLLIGVQMGKIFLDKIWR